MMIYIPEDLAQKIHQETVDKSGGGSYDVLNIGYLYSALEHIQNDDYYPSFEDKLTHLIWSINKNHSFSDGNKRLSITLGAQFLLMNGYLYCIQRFLFEMENISYHLAAGRIDKDLLSRLICSFIGNELDFDETLKLEYLIASAGGIIGFNE
ncbi:MAG: type II toxin-antitoxin system death-on-curing family toxin [Muribaculaceae bacterium]